MDPFERVAEWRPVSARWFLHRPEPLLHERMWGCSLPLPDEQRRRQPWHEEGGFDATGRPIAWRQVGHERGGLADPGAREIAVVEDGVTVVRREGVAVARTTYDGRGLPVRTEYPGDLGHETYEHDAAGRLVAIEESDRLWSTAGSERLDTGGRLVGEDLDERLLRAACIQQPGDPYRAVLGAVASKLARADWMPMLRPTPDFVVYIAEHDEGYAPKVESIRGHNPPDRVARWEASWPPGAPRGEDEWP
jgi:hypothetical protein